MERKAAFQAYFKESVDGIELIKGTETTDAVLEKGGRKVLELAEKKIKRICTDAVSKCLKEKSDPFRLGMLLARYDSDAYNSLCNDWKSHLPNVKVYVSTRAKASVVNASYTRR